MNRRVENVRSAGRAQVSAFLSCEVAAGDTEALERLKEGFAGESLAHLLVFASPTVEFSRLMKDLDQAFDCPVVGCTTAGEIGTQGYVDDSIIAIGLPAHSFAAETVLIRDLSEVDLVGITDGLMRKSIAVRTANQDKPNGFGFLLVDGMSRREDELVNAVALSLVNFPLFGGSAGDGLSFEKSFVSLDGAVHENAATLTYVVTNCETRVFSVNHMVPTDKRMVVTDAEPSSRVVKGINDEPAAAEYARIIGKDPAQLDELVFAAHPVTVRIGDQYHVRAIQRVNEDGDLAFFSAIDEGMVLTVAHAQDMAAHLDREVAQLVNGHGRPSILACDCVLRRIEAQKSQTAHRVNEVFRKYGIVGFSTYGEQLGPLHLNHTMTGVALIPPDASSG